MILELNAHKVFENGEIKYLYIAQNGALFELDEITDFLISMNGCARTPQQSRRNTKHLPGIISTPETLICCLPSWKMS